MILYLEFEYTQGDRSQTFDYTKPITGMVKANATGAEADSITGAPVLNNIGATTTAAPTTTV